MTSIVFSHANSFSGRHLPGAVRSAAPARLRSAPWSALATTRAIPSGNNWPHLVQQLADFAEQQQRRTGEPAFLVGQSHGRVPERDGRRAPPATGAACCSSTRHSSAAGAPAPWAAKQAQVVGAVTPAHQRARRNSWASTEEALEHFRRKRVFAQWGPAGAAGLRDPWPAGARRPARAGL